MRNPDQVLEVLTAYTERSDITIKTMYRSYLKHKKEGNEDLAGRIYNTRNNLKLKRIKINQAIRDLKRLK